MADPANVLTSLWRFVPSLDVHSTLLFAILIGLVFGLVSLSYRLRKMEAHVVAVDERLAVIGKEVRYEIPPSMRRRIERSILGVERRGVVVGVAFFISPSVALTVAHNLTPAHTVYCERFESHASDATEGDGGGGERLHFDVAHRDKILDFAVLRLRAGQSLARGYLSLPASDAPLPVGEKGIFLVTCNLRTAAKVPMPAASA